WTSLGLHHVRHVVPPSGDLEVDPLGADRAQTGTLLIRAVPDGHPDGPRAGVVHRPGEHDGPLPVVEGRRCRDGVVAVRTEPSGAASLEPPRVWTIRLPVPHAHWSPGRADRRDRRLGAR